MKKASRAGSAAASGPVRAASAVVAIAGVVAAVAFGAELLGGTDTDGADTGRSVAAGNTARISIPVDLKQVKATMDLAVRTTTGLLSLQDQSTFAVEDNDSAGVLTASTPASYDFTVGSASTTYRLFVSDAIAPATGGPSEVCANRIATGLAVSCEVLESSGTAVIESVGIVTSEQVPVGRSAIPGGFVRYDRSTIAVGGSGPLVAFHESVLSRPTENYKSLFTVPPADAAALVTQPTITSLR